MNCDQSKEKLLELEVSITIKNYLVAFLNLKDEAMTWQGPRAVRGWARVVYFGVIVFKVSHFTNKLGQILNLFMLIFQLTELIKGNRFGEHNLYDNLMTKFTNINNKAKKNER